MEGYLLWHFILDIISLFSIYGIVVLSLNLEAGYTGIPNFGKMMGVAVGAFASAGVASRLLLLIYNHTHTPIKYSSFVEDNSMIMAVLNKWLSAHPVESILYLLLTCAIAMTAGAFIGYLASYPAIRLREDYLAITLLAVAEVIKSIGYNCQCIAGGTLGLQVPDPFAFAGKYRYEVATLTLVLALIIVYLVYDRMLNSPLGRVLRAIRDDSDAALALGKDIAKYRMKILVIGTATAALAGALYSSYTIGVIATAYDRTSWTFWPWAMMMIGGMGNNKGVLLGCFLFVLIRYNIMRFKYAFQSILPFNVSWLEFILLGVAIIVILLVRPQGVIPEKPIRTINRILGHQEKSNVGKKP